MVSVRGSTTISTKIRPATLIPSAATRRGSDLSTTLAVAHSRTGTKTRFDGSALASSRAGLLRQSVSRRSAPWVICLRTMATQTCFNSSSAMFPIEPCSVSRRSVISCQGLNQS